MILACDLRSFPKNSTAIVATFAVSCLSSVINLLEQIIGRADGKFGAAKVMLRPAAPGTGVIAGGTVRVVLELAGLENALGKQLGSDNALNNARATIVAMQKMRTLREVAAQRGLPMEELWK